MRPLGGPAAPFGRAGPGNPKVYGFLIHKPQDLERSISYEAVNVKSLLIIRGYYSISSKNCLTPTAQVPGERGVYFAIISSGVV